MLPMKPNKKGIARIINACRYSWYGLQAAYKREEAFRQELLLCVFLLLIIFLLDITTVEALLLLGSLVFLIVMELINTTIEVIIDRMSEEYHELSKQAKDIGSALVLIALLYLIVVWTTVLFL